MSKIPGSIPITGFIAPTDSNDKYPTHLDVYGKGGYRTVLDIASLNSISFDRRVEGMLVYVVSNAKIYQLTGPIAENNWIEFNSLPPLGTFTIAGITYPKIYVGTESGVPEASESYGYALTDIAALNFRFLTANFIMGDALVQSAYPSSQFIVNLDDGVLAKTGKTLRKAVAGTDFVDINQAPIENSVAVWLANNTKILKNTQIKILEGNVENGDDIFGIRTITANSVISRSGITSNDSVFALKDVGTRELKIYDRNDVGAGRLSKSVNFISAFDLMASVNFYLPETPSALGKVLADVGETIYDGRVFRKLDFVDLPGKNSKYILQQADPDLPNSQALNELGLGILKTNLDGSIALASGGKTPEINDYVRPVDLLEEINRVLATASEAGATAGSTAGATAGTASGTTAGALAGTEAGSISGATAGTTAGTVAGTTAALLVVSGKEDVSAHNQDINALNARIDNLKVKLVGDITSDSLISGDITTTFRENAEFKGNYVKIPKKQTDFLLSLGMFFYEDF
jgi:hypothetical protein